VLAEHFGKIVFPGVVAKRDSYSRAAGEGQPVWNMKGAAARDAGREIRGIFETVAQKMDLE
jgi:chromosome partitioning protein